MRTDFHAILRNHAPARTREDIDHMTWEEARAYYYSHKNEWATNKPKDMRDTVCFTGFTLTEKTELERLAEAKNMRVVDQVNMGLHFLVCGPNAGPKKLEKASAQSVAIMSDTDFRTM